MTHAATFRGVPHRLARDGWWLTAGTPPEVLTDVPSTMKTAPAAPPDKTNAGPARGGAGASGHLLRVLALITLADVLFWTHAPGVSLAVFAAALFAASLQDMRTAHRHIGPLILLGASVLPVIEHVQTMSVACLGLGTLAACYWARHPAMTAPALAHDTLRCALRFPRAWAWSASLEPLIRGAAHMHRTSAPPDARQWARNVIRNWAFPAGGLLVLLSLLVQANPVLDHWLSVPVWPEGLHKRVLFWLGIALMVAPFVNAATFAPVAPAPRTGYTLRWLGLNEGSVLRALFVFNAALAVQSLLDVSILMGRTQVPDGMSYANYAHRGAYPLLVTALLAGGFAMAARQHLEAHRWMRPLLLLWLGQNLLLCLSSALRLETYVEAYGLTYLRFHAFVWMGGVAAALGLALWQVWHARSNGWLILRTGALAGVVLYGLCFLNVAQVITHHNLSEAHAPTDRAPDYWYLCQLGPMASAALASGAAQDAGHARQLNARECLGDAPAFDGWRSWGFRAHRVRAYNHTITAMEAAK